MYILFVKEVCGIVMNDKRLGLDKILVSNDCHKHKINTILSYLFRRD